MLAQLGYQITATDYGASPPITWGDRVAGVDLNSCLPFRSATFDTVTLGISEQVFCNVV